MINTLAFAVLIFALPLSAADLSGTWTGTLEINGPDGRPQTDRCYIQLKQSGSKIVGTVGPEKSVRWSIHNGKTDGTRIGFEVLPPEGGRLTFDLRLAGSRLVGEALGENRGLAFKAKVDLTRMTN